MSLARAVVPGSGPHFRGAGSRPRRRMLGYLAPVAGLALGASVVMAAPAYAAQAPVGLGTADSFAILAGSGITNTGPTTVNGDIGTFPTPSETGFGSITDTGTNHDGDAVTQGAKPDLVTAYNDAAGRGPTTNVATELGGTTLTAGVYTSPTLGLTGTLTLDGQGRSNSVFIFKAGSTLITASNSRVLLINGAQACNVFWQVGSSATFNTGTAFVGNVMTSASITAETAATFQGRLLARDGAVTLDTNTITRPTCAVTPPAPAPAPTASSSGSPTPTPSTTPTATPTKTPTAKPSVGPVAPSGAPSGGSGGGSGGGGSGGGGSGGGGAGGGGAGGGGAGGGGKTPSGGGATTVTHSPTPAPSSHHSPTPSRSPGIPLPGLPFTGMPIGALVGIALLLMVLGSFALVTTRRTRRHQHSEG